MSNNDSSPIEQFEAKIGADWKNLRIARNRSVEQKKTLEKVLSIHASPEDTSLVVFGSLAREEFTSSSDIDWVLLIDGLGNPQHFENALDIKAAIDEELEARHPGIEGTFGGLSFSHDLIHMIGGNEDTNKNTTHRILMLLESIAISKGEAHNRVITQILRRYIEEDWGWMHKKVSVPRFLLNDIIRYWRTITVDFGYKRRQRRGEGWALRTAKLRMSRKLIFASGLLSCFSCSLNSRNLEAGNKTETIHKVLEHLVQLSNQTPLNIFSQIVLSNPSLTESTKMAIDSYDKFIGLLNDDDFRTHLKELTPAKADEDTKFNKIREIGHSFQKGLDGIFFEDNGTEIPELTKQYGMF